MKALSLWQPWATLIACGAKSIETRSWPARTGGLWAIHAAKRWDRGLRSLANTSPFIEALNQAGYGGDAQIPFGAIVAVARLVASVEIPDQTTDFDLTNPDGRITHRVTLPPDYPEFAFGDYAPGRYAWIFDNIRPLRKPLPWKGRQGPFEVPDELIRQAL